MANPAPRRKRLGTDRLLADVYGASFQRRLVSEAQLLDSYIGQLRFDTLFAKTVVVPDAHLLDGVFFLSIEPDALVRAIGRGMRARTMPIEWRCRSTAPPGSRLAGSLRSLLFRSDSEHLNTYAFNAIGDSALRVHLAEELGRVSARTLEREFATTRDAAEIPARLAAFLRRFAGATPDLDMMEQGWRRWIEAERSGLLSTAVWNRPFDLVRALKTDRPLNPRRLHTAEARRFFQRVDEVLAYSRHRSDMTMLFEQARSHFGWRTDAEQNPDDLEARDLRTIDNWYSQGRYLAAARQHGADISFVTDPYSTPLDRAETRSRKLDLGGGRVDVVMADEILPGLTLLDDDEFAKFTRMQRGRLAAVWRDGSSRQLRDLVRELESCVDRAAPAQAKSQRRLGRLTWMSLVAGPVAGLGAHVSAGQEALSTVASAALAAGTALAGATVDYAKSRPAPATRRVVTYLRRRRG